VRRFRFRTEPAAEGSALWGGVTLLSDQGGPAGAPNLVLLSLDTLGAAYLSAFGNRAGDRTDVSPRIDAFLGEGFSFDRANAQYGNTLVSHVSLFSALYPRRHGLYPHTPFVPFDSLVERLADAGYRTTAFTEGAYVASGWGFARGFDDYDDGSIGLESQTSGHADETFARAADWLARSGRDAPFFLFVHTYEVHLPYLLEGKEDAAIAAAMTPDDPRRIPPARQAQGTLAHNSGRSRFPPRDLDRLRALHTGEVHRLDGVVGRFLDRLAELGLEESTLVVLTADHGDQFGEDDRVGHGNSLHNRVLHVPLAFRWPGRIAPGHSDTPVQLVDVLPTLLDLAGLAAPDDLDGRSLAPAMRGETLPEHAAYAELLSGAGECARLALPEGCRVDRYAAQTRRFKLVRSQVPPFERLYDLERDPLETRDVAARHPGELARLEGLLDDYMALPPSEHVRSGEGRIDAQTLRALKALGYAQ
jgi:arylsulfatase A-like enzyme